MKNNIQDLYQQLNQKFAKENQLALFQTAIGKNYSNCKVKFMLVGRCTNGGSTEEIKAHPNFGWVKNWFSEGHGLTRNAFFKTGGNVFKRLANYHDQEYVDSEWYENIIWTNLYRIAPQLGGNPPDNYLNEQRAVCQRLLLEDIIKYNPNYILFVTDWDYWITKFFDQDYLKVFKKLDNNNVINAKGILLGSKALIVRRPDNPRKKFSHDEYEEIIVNNFKDDLY